MDLNDFRVNGKRMQGTLEQMAQIGATPGGGVQRLTLSDEDKKARDLFIKWLKELDLEITIDEMGNIFGRRPGTNNDLAPVVAVDVDYFAVFHLGGCQIAKIDGKRHRHLAMAYLLQTQFDIKVFVVL